MNSRVIDKALKKNDALMLELHHMAHFEIVRHTLDGDIKEQLEKTFPKVFSLLTELPPERATDHKIELIPNSTPINQRPYKYSYIQKDEIDLLVKELLHSEFIMPSFSPFVSPVLLVKKKDNGWRFCINYRALNRIIVPNQYPITVVEELLDEPHGATVFSKLDLKSGYY